MFLRLALVTLALYIGYYALVGTREEVGRAAKIIYYMFALVETVIQQHG